METITLDLRKDGIQMLGSDPRCTLNIQHEAIAPIHLQFNHTPGTDSDFWVVQQANGKDYSTEVVRGRNSFTLVQDQAEKLHENDTFVCRRHSDGATTAINVAQILGRRVPDAVISSNPPDAPPVSAVGQTEIASLPTPPSIRVYCPPESDADDAILAETRADIAAKSQRDTRKSNGATRTDGGFLRMIRDVFGTRAGRNHPDAERAQARDQYADEGMPLPSNKSSQRTRDGAHTMATDPKNQTPGQLPTTGQTPAPRQLTAGQATADDKPATAQTAISGQEAPASEKKPEPEKKGWWSQNWNWPTAIGCVFIALIGLVGYESYKAGLSAGTTATPASASASQASAAAPPAPTTTATPWAEYEPSPAERDAALPSEVGNPTVVVVTVDASETSVPDASDSATDADASEVSDAPATETKPAFTSCVPMTLENAKLHLGSAQTSIEHLQTKVEGVDGILNCKDATPAPYWQPDDTLFATGCTICPPAASSDAMGKK